MSWYSLIMSWNANEMWAYNHNTWYLYSYFANEINLKEKLHRWLVPLAIDSNILNFYIGSERKIKKVHLIETNILY